MAVTYLSGTKVRVLNIVSLTNLPGIFEDDPAANEHVPAFRYSKVSRHYGLSAGKPSSWVNSPVFALRVWSHVPNTWDYC